MRREPRAIVVFYDEFGKRYEFPDGSDNLVEVRLNGYFRGDFKLYKPGDVIVIPREIAKRIDCEVLRKWKSKRESYTSINGYRGALIGKS